MGNLRNGAVHLEVRVAIVVRMLTGAFHLATVLTQHISRSTIYQIFFAAIEILIEALGFPNLTSTKQTCTILSRGVSMSCHACSSLFGCVGEL